jgi:hypothetical protein
MVDENLDVKNVNGKTMWMQGDYKVTIYRDLIALVSDVKIDSSHNKKA